MLFNSIEFALFFPLVCCLYFAVPIRARVGLLLVASCVFYMVFIPAYIFILFLTIGIDYTAGIFIEKSHGHRRRVWLIGSIISTCAVLFVFKYFNFFTASFTSIAQLLGWHIPENHWNIILPIGLSFHTFQSLSYVVEVYRRKQEAEYNFINYATYVMFFPQLVAGPIERPQNLLHQFCEVHPFDYDRVTSGLKRMAWGFFKKLVVADRLALYVNDVYSAPRNHNGLQLTLGTFFFAYQIYCDFSGYSDIAIGTARVLGFRLIENFSTPYHSLSVSEFWRRWHISLSTWFKDYVYVPLGGSRVTTARWIFNVMVTFALSGLWHGANWTYVLWGFLNGFYLVFGQLTKRFRNSFFGLISWTEETLIRKALMLLSTFALTCGAWVLFRARNLGDALYIFRNFFIGWDFHQVRTQQFFLRQLPVAILAIVLLECCELIGRRIPVERVAVNLPGVFRWAGYTVFIFGIILFGVFRREQFIYFQF